MINAELTTVGKLMAILTAPGAIRAVLTQGPMIVNDYVFTVAETDTEYIFTVRRGSEVQNITLPKNGGGVDFDVDETLKLENGVLSVNTTNLMEQDNTLPITSAGVYTTVGNIEALLKTI